jgi:hypothetical protein
VTKNLDLKLLNFDIFLWAFFALLGTDLRPDSESGSTDLIESGTETP